MLFTWAPHIAASVISDHGMLNPTHLIIGLLADDMKCRNLPAPSGVENFCSWRKDKMSMSTLHETRALKKLPENRDRLWYLFWLSCCRYWTHTTTYSKTHPKNMLSSTVSTLGDVGPSSLCTHWLNNMNCTWRVYDWCCCQKEGWRIVSLISTAIWFLWYTVIHS